MSLPELTLPQYELTLPVLKKKVKYRPFIVKEEKVLLLALQEKGVGEIVRVMKQIVSSCTFDKLKVDDLTTADIEYLFINIRNKSFGEGVEVEAKCTNPVCERTTKLMLDMSKLTVKSDKVDPEIQLMKDVWLVMRYPSIDATYALVDAEDKIVASEELIAHCIVSLIVGDKTYDFQETAKESQLDFVNRLTHEQIDKIQNFIVSAPKIIFKDTFKCIHCGKENTIEMEGMQSFFD